MYPSKNHVTTHPDYADDNTVSYSHKNLDILKEDLVDESAIRIDWFRDNKMQANPDKFQAIMLGKSGFENCKSLFLNGTEIKCEDSVKLLNSMAAVKFLDLIFRNNFFILNYSKMCSR